MHSFDQPPFPRLQWESHRWEGSIVVPAWAEFRLRSSEQTSNEVDLGIGTKGAEPKVPTPEQSAAFEFFVENDARIRDAILAELFVQYPQWQEEYGYSPEELEEYMPSVQSADGFKTLLELSDVHIFSQSRDDCAYVGVTCNCEWDPEHAFGAMMHRDRVVEIGGADVAILEWIAERDANSQAA